MNILRIYPTSINECFVRQAVQALQRGELIIYPTDTFYAIAADCLNQKAIVNVCTVKGIDPRKHVLSVMCADISQASQYARIDNRAYDVLRSHTPGAFTFLLPSATTLPKAFKGRRQIGVRIDTNPIARALARELGHPMLTASLCEEGNAGEIYCRYEGLKAVTVMVDGGNLEYPAPSTVVDLTEAASPEILRQGKGVL